MSDPDVHIAEWQAAGLIDAAFADRLRTSAGGTKAGQPAAPDAPSPLGSFFGPSPTVGEMFAYLGAAFLLGAWLTYLGSVIGGLNREAISAAGLGLATLVMVGLGISLARGDARRRRAAGIAFVVATALAAGAAAFVVQIDVLRNTLQAEAPSVVIALVSVAAAIAFRRYLPAVATQLGFLVALTALAGAVLLWLQALVVPVDQGVQGVGPCCPSQPSTPVGLVLGAAVWWLLVALLVGILGLREEGHAADDPGAARRAAVIRFWAGIVAIVGLATTLSQSGTDASGNYVRILEPWVADLAILILAIVLIERAFRRGSTVFILAGAIGLITAFTDYNFSYLAESIYIGLLIEGVILLAVGFGADRLRRRVDRPTPAAQPA